MVQIGTIEYEARVTGAGEARSKTEDLQESQEDLAEASEESAGVMNRFAGTVETGGENAGNAAHNVGIMDTATRLLGSTATFVTGALGGMAARILGISGATAAASGALSTLTGWLSGLTLSGIIGSAVGAIKGFAGWLAAGSAGALAFAGAVGAGLGLLGVWALQVTGALDAVRGFGTWVRDRLPGWVRDGLLQIISLAVGPLAALGGFITGTLEGGFGEGVRRARQVIGVFVGAWQRNINRVVRIGQVGWNRIKQGVAGLRTRAVSEVGKIRNFAENSWSRIASGAQSMKQKVVGFFGDIGTAATNQFRSGFNSVVPSSIDIPSVTIGGGSIAGQDIPSTTIGGGSLSLPQLQTGGMIEQSGAAVVHEGEAVVPEPIVSAAESGGGGGGGDTIIEVDVGGITLRVDGSGFDPNDLSRRELESLADQIASAIGKKTSTVAGTR